MDTSRNMSVTLALRRYFSSGWAFLIPYLAAYLLYYLLKWPVNPVAASNGGSVGGGPSSVVLPLLRVYWALHAANLVLAVIALRTWWRDQSRSAFRFSLSAFLPWLLLAALFYIPGVYLEYPADTWEHYRRINEWSWLQAVGEHSAWAKSSYFFAYSLLGRISPPTRQIFWLDFYYMGACLLLCWQYYRLARAVGLGERASMLFVLLQTVLFGNNIFGFYRYYGISSSIFAQLGAVALIRMAIVYANQKFQVPGFKFQGTPAEFSQEQTKGMVSAKAEEVPNTDEPAVARAVDGGHGLPRIGAAPLSPSAPVKPAPEGEILGHEEAQKSPKRTLPIFGHIGAFLRPTKSAQPAAHEGRSGLSCLLFTIFFLLRAALPAFALLALIAFNHVQGLGIATLGLAAVIIWRLIEWRRSMIGWLAGAAVVLNVAAILWWPRNPALDAVYRPAGWLSAWYGFNLFSPSSPAFDRTMAILGILGVVNLLAGFFLLRRNHVVAWLTITPLLALSMPVVAIPFAGMLAGQNVDEVITFHRMLLAIPSGLALVVLGAQIAKDKCRVSFFKFRGSAPLFSLHSMKTDIPAAHEEIACNKPPAGGAEERISAFRLSVPGSQSSRFASFLFSPISALLCSAVLLTILPASRPGYNRLFNGMMIPPADLTMRHVIEAMGVPFVQSAKAGHNIPLLTTCGQGAVAAATGYRNTTFAFRTVWIARSMVVDLPGAIVKADRLKASAFLLVPSTASLQSSTSVSGLLSGHWLPQAAVLEYTAGREIEKAAKEVGSQEIERSHGKLYSLGDTVAH